MRLKGKIDTDMLLVQAVLIGGIDLPGREEQQVSLPRQNPLAVESVVDGALLYVNEPIGQCELVFRPSLVVHLHSVNQPTGWVNLRKTNGSHDAPPSI